MLLILAGVTIATLAGPNGILTQAQNAKNKTEEAEVKEREDLDKQNELIDNIVNEGSSSGGGSLPSTEDTKPFLPDGSEVIEDKLDKGVVIKDKNENEWVWIEVPRTIVYETAGLKIDTSKPDLTQNEYDAIEKDLKKYTEQYREDWSDKWYAWDEENENLIMGETATESQKQLNNGCGLTYNEYNEIYKRMLKSVYTNGGFYIGRYEMGIDKTTGDIETAKKYVRTEDSERISESSPKAISKRNAIPYDFVTCGEAQYLAKRMNPDTSRISSLMFGIQWDLVCKYLEVSSDLDEKDINQNSAKWGNYSGVSIENIKEGKYATYRIIGATLNEWAEIPEGQVYTKPEDAVYLSTGITEYCNKMNIYNFASNAYEFTLERAKENLSSPCAIRGGGFSGGSYFSASNRDAFSVDYGTDGVVGRPALY